MFKTYLFLSAFFATSAIAAPLFQGSVGALSNQLASGVGDVDGNKYNTDINLSYHKDIANRLEQKFTFNGLINDQNGKMYSVNEAYIGNKGEVIDFKIGREILDWSDIDGTWGFGKVNNRQNFNGFDPGQEGLTGLSLKFKTQNGFRAKFFGSYLYAPETNPSLDINNSNGTITSKNPWSDPPASSARLESRDVPIQYHVQYPKTSDVVFRYSLGLNLGWENKHWVVDSFLMRKPENQISETVDISYNTGDDKIKAFIQPQFYYHDVYGSNIKYRNKDLTMYLSGIAIRPNTYPDGDPLVTQYTQLTVEKRREDYVGGGVSKDNDKMSLGLNYVARLSPFNRIDDVLAQDPRWNQAVNTYVRYRFNRFFMASVDGKYDMLTTDRLVMVRASYNASKNMLVNVGVNMIGTPTDGKSYWSPYTNNDAVYASVRYIF